MEQFNRYLPEQPIIENDDFAIYGNEDLQPVKVEILTYLSEQKLVLLDFFDLKSYKKISINLFNNHDTYIEFTRQFEEPAPYSIGNFIHDMINYFYDINKIARLKKALIHELVHCLYQSIWENKYDRVLWLDEGLALYLSGEKNLLEKDKDKFKAWYLDKIIRRDKEIPKMAFLKEHGSTYGTFVDYESNKYDGYNLSYLMVRYLIENNYDIISLLKDYQKIKSLETHILQDCIKYYNDYFQVSKI